MTPKPSSASIYRILDANLNRLREALRVVEEYFRFVSGNARRAARLKKLRHDCTAIEVAIGRNALLTHRDTSTDPFGRGVRREELVRSDRRDLLCANLRRGEEAARCIEEYAKLLHDRTRCVALAKKVRFELYALEQMFFLAA